MLDQYGLTVTEYVLYGLTVTWLVVALLLPIKAKKKQQ